jgi:hypothetical protein
MFSGTEPHRLDAQQQVREISAEGGTNRLPALEEALRFNPDVIYFLTDSEDPMLPADLEEVRRRNRSGAQIHCIEFRKGPPLLDGAGRPIPNFLHKLAAMTGGRYAYRDTQTLSPR